MPMQSQSQSQIQAQALPQINNVSGEGQEYDYGITQAKTQVNIDGAIDLSKNIEPTSIGLRMKMSELDHAYLLPMNARYSGDPTWTTVLDMCPQFLVLDPVTNDYYGTSTNSELGWG